VIVGHPPVPRKRATNRLVQLSMADVFGQPQYIRESLPRCDAGRGTFLPHNQMPFGQRRLPDLNTLP